MRQGHPWVYADRLRGQNRPGAGGELAMLYDRRDRFLGIGLFDPDSPLRVRMLHVGDPVRVDGGWWRAHLNAALERRAGHFDPATTGWRCIHGENDRWPGLVLDRYEDVYVLKLYTSAWLGHLPELIPLFVQRLEPRSLVLRLSRNIAAVAAARGGFLDGAVLHGADPGGAVVFREDGLRFEAEVIRGQKTGFFLDQRENRRRVGALARGIDVLNCFSFSGGFSLHAARGGARRVTDLDISPHALAGARRNFTLNQDLPTVAAARHETIQADTFEWLDAAASPSTTFDLVILDPPSMARRATERAGALAAYGRLASLGAARVRAGGILLAASCSAHVGAEDFFGLVLSTLRRTGRRATELERATHPVDHPATFAEAHYLKALYVRLD